MRSIGKWLSALLALTLALSMASLPALAEDSVIFEDSLEALEAQEPSTMVLAPGDTVTLALTKTEREITVPLQAKAGRLGIVATGLNLRLEVRDEQDETVGEAESDPNRVLAFALQAEEGTYQLRFTSPGKKTGSFALSILSGKDFDAFRSEGNSLLQRSDAGASPEDGTEAPEESEETIRKRLAENQMPPIIVSQPGIVCAAIGETAVFTVKAVGATMNLTWQWQKADAAGTAWTDIKGAVADTWKVKVTKALNGLQVRCVVKDGNGLTTETEAGTLKVGTLIRTQPKAAVSAAVGAKVSLLVKATGMGLKYQWQVLENGAEDWTDLAGATKKNYVIASVTAKMNGNAYRCAVKGTDTVISEASVLSVKTVITTQPADLTLKANKTGMLKIRATGVGLTYKWQTRAADASVWQDAELTGAATDTCKIKMTEALHGLQARCVVTDANGISTVSKAATLTLSGAKNLPEDKSVSGIVGRTLTLKADTKAVSYTWQMQKSGSTKWQNVKGATAAKLVLKLKASNNGQKYRCKMKTAKGKIVYSKTYVVSVNAKITKQPVATEAAAGKKASLKVNATGVKLTWQWQVQLPGTACWNNADGSSAKASYSVKADAALDGAKYRCVITDANGNQTVSKAVALTVVSLTGTPEAQEVLSGENLTFGVEAVNAASWQWQHRIWNGKKWSSWENVSGATGAEITLLTNDSMIESETMKLQYRCQVKGKTASLYSGAIPVTVLENALKDYFYDASGETVTIYAYRGTAEEVIIPASFGGKQITALGEDAFRDNTTLKTVKIPATVTTIGASAFEGCTALEKVTLSDHVASMGKACFKNCTSLASMEIDNQE